MDTANRVGDDHLLLREMAMEVEEWAKSKGWWQDGRTFGDECALMHSEISEALESYRVTAFESWTGDNDKPEGVGSELADLFIRLLHTCGEHDIDLFAEYRAKMDFNYGREYRHGNRAL